MKKDKPLSPHIQIYRPQLTSVLSILHRVTGLTLVMLSFCISAWLLTGVYGPEYYQDYIAILSHPLMRPFSFLALFAFFYHLFNGLRHLLWDTGWGLDLKTAYKTGWSVVALSIGLTLIFWISF